MGRRMIGRTSLWCAAMAAALLVFAATPSLAGDQYPPSADDNVQPYPLDTVPVANPPVFRDQSDLYSLPASSNPPPNPPMNSLSSSRTPPSDALPDVQTADVPVSKPPVADAPPHSLNARNTFEPRDRTLDLKTADVKPRQEAPRKSANFPDYKLDAGDKVRVIVYGEDDLGGEFEVDGSGFVRLPLVGQVQAAGFTLREFEDQVTTQLADGYVNNPRVSVEVSAYRPFFIIGEVNRPGEYPYKNNMNLLTAIALAGGYTYRADDSDIYIRRSGSTVEQEFPADASTRVMPGDIIRISERFF